MFPNQNNNLCYKDINKILFRKIKKDEDIRTYQSLVHPAVAKPFAIVYAVRSIDEHSITVPVAALITAIPDVAVSPIVDTIAMALAIVEFTDVYISVGIRLFLE